MTRKGNFTKHGIYKLTSKDYKKKYVGQTGQPSHKIFREHFNDFKFGNGNSKFAQHLLDNRHSIGTVEEIMDVLHVVEKGKQMDTVERFHIYKETKIENQINDRITVARNILFDTALQNYASRWHPSPPVRSEQR